MQQELIEISLHILKVLAFFMSAPLVFSIFYKLTRFALNIIDPVKTIEIQTVADDGSVTTDVIQLDNTNELVQALLNTRGKNVK
ncbi:hypothetical protein VCRA2119O240_50166 [Vibrio crassostreae]|uniref:hypothetical protein n=1 Tax=Vibrio TaxID=662 RepID=UPI001052C89B|nr:MULTISPECIES: hypothetical protein [Vibrio]MCF7495040.1 hypothetical protein [Vibrio sp. L5-1]TCT58315.1 hypothetical protein EDB44_12159 [Vibrio crassostreae]TCT79094.1 hypothetical protein EDB43_12151 [Vibrio crassostreae]CAK1777739.1 hypothetical protein VCRA2119O47_150072 [Vibrio crassostreae]CAK1779693.1 hypothetical protein VCRA2119O44_150075 [Vibrio crassostreae]